MSIVRLLLFMLIFGAGRSAMLAQQHGTLDPLAMVVAVAACFGLLALRQRRRS